ncbi:hypothetical protein [Puia dinghuensis]|uniref:Uncharacterized protein n=1 Tax=Puia dinghuensis TaxID=1792502 RepID=A0A8J2UK35_9BACT|nr:hypothetical protein [Puia dinghuensis]GGB26267.1 hypothetical protein GCM10011511_57770 [Puia dinghuensis]
MYVKEINEVKENLDLLTNQGIIEKWELPYENLLTRLSAAIFFFSTSSEDPGNIPQLSESLGKFPNFSYRINTEKKLSNLTYRLTFSEEELKKNSSN